MIEAIFNAYFSNYDPVCRPYVGCIRDVMDPEQNLIDFNKVLYHTGPEFGVCKTEKAVDPVDNGDGGGKPSLRFSSRSFYSRSTVSVQKKLRQRPMLTRRTSEQTKR